MATQTKEFTEICREIIALFESAQSLAEQITSDKTALATIEANVLAAQSAIETAQSDITSKKADFDTKKAEFDAYYNTLTALKAAFTTLNDTMTASAQSVSENKTAFDTKFAEFKANYMNFLAVMSEFEGNLVNAQAFWANFESDYAALQALKADLQEIIASQTFIDDTTESEVKAYSSSKTTALLSAETVVRENADTALQDNITAEATVRAEADATLQGNIAAEATARAEAIAAEVNARNTAILNAKSELNSAITDGLNAKENAGAAANLDATLKTELEGEIDAAILGQIKVLDTLDAAIGDFKQGQVYYCSANDNIYLLKNINDIEISEVVEEKTVTTTVPLSAETTLNTLISAGAVENITPLGVGQSWQDVANQRQVEVTYTNNTNRPIVVSISWDGGGSGDYYGLSINDVMIASGRGTNTYATQLSTIILPGDRYVLKRLSTNPLVTFKWFELR